jgi:membrane-associated phospholipid phosphatase
MLGASINLAIALVVSIWWKISLHMIGIGGLVGLFFALSTRIYFEITTYLIAAVAIAGIVAWARLRLNTHNPPQVYVGFILGWISVASTILLLS